MGGGSYSREFWESRPWLCSDITGSCTKKLSWSYFELLDTLGGGTALEQVGCWGQVRMSYFWPLLCLLHLSLLQLCSSQDHKKR